MVTSATLSILYISQMYYMTSYTIGLSPTCWLAADRHSDVGIVVRSGQYVPVAVFLSGAVPVIWSFEIDVYIAQEQRRRRSAPWREIPVATLGHLVTPVITPK